MKQLITTLISLAILSCGIVSCSSSEEIDEPTTTPASEQFYTCELPASSDFFRKAYIKGPTQYVLNAYYPGGNPLMEIFINGTDIIGIYFNSEGLPELVTDGSQYLVLGSHNGNTLKCGVIYKDGSTELLDVVTDTDWTKLKEQLNGTKSRVTSDTPADNQKEKLVNLATWSSIEIILTQLAGKGFGLGTVGSVMFLAEAFGYSISDNQQWLEAVSAIADDAGLVLTLGEAVIFGTNPIGLSVFTARVWGEGVFYPIYKGGYFKDHEDATSPHAAKIEMLYKSVNNAAFATSSAQISWLGGDFEVELLVNGANFDTNDLEWMVVSEQPDWMNAFPRFRDGHHLLYVNVMPNFSENENQGSPAREHTVRVRLTNLYENPRELTFHVQQYGRLCTDPTAIIFEDLTTKDVLVTSKDQWDITYCPSWCKVMRHGLYGFSVTPTEIRPGLSDDIIIQATTLTTFPSMPSYPYTVKIPVSCGLGWDGTSWNFSGKVDCSGSVEGDNFDLSQVTDFGLIINSVAGNDFSFTGDLSGFERGSKLSIDDKGRLVWTYHETFSDDNSSAIADLSLIFTREESDKAIGDVSGTFKSTILLSGGGSVSSGYSYSGRFSGTLVQGDNIP